MRTILVALTLMLMAPLAMATDIMTPDAARKAALAGEVVLVDIRTPEEWAATGVPDASHTLNMHGPDFGKRLMALIDANPNKPVALICATGGRSTYLSKALEKHGVPVKNVAEGMMGGAAGPGWRKRGLPVRKPDAPMVTK